MKQFALIILLLGCLGLAEAQEQGKKISKKEKRRQQIDALIRQEEEGVIAYSKHSLAGFKLTNDGYGGFLEIGRARSVKSSLLFQLEISERKHEKEYKQQIFNSTPPLIYGKINYFYPIKLGLQKQILLGNKGNKNGICVTANFGGGLSMAMLRPYMPEVQKNGMMTFVAYESADSAYFLNGPYYGGPSFNTGWSRMKVKPGIHAKAGLRFDYGRYNEMVNAIEVGVSAEYYSDKIAQMIEIQPYQGFYSAFVAVLFGRRK